MGFFWKENHECIHGDWNDGDRYIVYDSDTDDNETLHDAI